MSIKMITIKGQTVVYDNNSRKIKYIGVGAEGVRDAVRYTERLRFGEKVNGTYIPGEAEKTHPVLSLMPELEKQADGSFALAKGV